MGRLVVADNEYKQLSLYAQGLRHSHEAKTKTYQDQMEAAVNEGMSGQVSENLRLFVVQTALMRMKAQELCRDISMEIKSFVPEIDEKDRHIYRYL